MKNTIIITLFSLLFSAGLFAQDEEKLGCGTTGMDSWFEHYMDNRDHYQFEIPEMPVYLPLTIHILGTDNGFGYYPTSTLFAALCQLNEDFAASNLQFYVQGDINYINRDEWYNHPEFSGGIQMMNANNVPRTVNCYFVQNPAGTCGYYTGQGNAVALSKSCNSASDHTWAHELGHFFTLPHTFVGWEGTTYNGTLPGGNRRGVENVNRSNCRSTSDRFCDTPSDYLSFRWTCNGEGKSNQTQTDPNGERFQSDGTLFMSYSNDACMTRFSVEQMQAMNVDVRNRRSNLLVNPTVLPPITETVTEVSPSIDEAVIFDEARLTWNSVENATGYYVRVSRIPNLSALFEFEGFVTDTFVNLPELSIGRTYYWRVQPFNNFSYCTNVSSTFRFDAAEILSTSNNSNLDFSLFPVPLSVNATQIFVEGLSDSEQYEYDIINTQGQLMDRGSLNSSTLQLNGSLSSGMYYLRINNGKDYGTAKVVVR